MNIVKGLIRILKSSTESNLRTAIGPSLPLIPCIIEHIAQLKNRYMMGADGRTPPEKRLRIRGVQRLCELGEKVLFAALAPARQGDFGARFQYWISTIPAKNKYSYKQEIKSRTIGLHQITDITDL